MPSGLARQAWGGLDPASKTGSRALRQKGRVGQSGVEETTRNGAGIVTPRRRSRQDVTVGARYRHRDVPGVTWEVIALYVGVDGKRHAVLCNISDPTWRKTISEIELEQSGQYEPVAVP